MPTDTKLFVAGVAGAPAPMLGSPPIKEKLFCEREALPRAGLSALAPIIEDAISWLVPPMPTEAWAGSAVP